MRGVHFHSIETSARLELVNREKLGKSLDGNFAHGSLLFPVASTDGDARSAGDPTLPRQLLMRLGLVQELIGKILRKYLQERDWFLCLDQILLNVFILQNSDVKFFACILLHVDTIQFPIKVFCPIGKPRYKKQ